MSKKLQLPVNLAYFYTEIRILADHHVKASVDNFESAILRD